MQPYEEVLGLPSPATAPPIPEDAAMIVVADVHPEEEVHQITRATRISERYPIVSAHPQAALLGVRHIGPNEMVVSHFDVPFADPSKLTPEDLAASALKSYLGNHVFNPSTVVVTPHSNTVGLELVDVGPLTTYRAIALAGSIGVQHVTVSDFSIYRAVPNALAIEYSQLSSAIDCMEEGGIFDQFNQLSNSEVIKQYQRACDRQLSFYRCFEICAMGFDGQPLRSEQWDALQALEQTQVGAEFASIPSDIAANLLGPFDIPGHDKPVLSMNWGYDNNSLPIEALGMYSHPSTKQLVPRKMCFAQVAVPISPPEPLEPLSRKQGWLYFPDLIDAINQPTRHDRNAKEITLSTLEPSLKTVTRYNTHLIR